MTHRSQTSTSAVCATRADFGPTLAGEKLAEHGLKVSRETLRKLMIEAGFWKPRGQRLKAVHVWRERLADIVCRELADATLPLLSWLSRQ